MKLGLMVLSLVVSMSSVSFAEQTVSEAATATKNDIKRTGKKAMHRMQEVVCTEGDMKCLAQKAEHRVEETTDKVVDKTKEAADKADNNKKSNH